MNDQKKTKKQPIDELNALHKKTAGPGSFGKSHPNARDEILNPMVFYRYVLDNIDEGIMVMDKDDKIFFVNNAMAKIAGIAKEQLLGAVALRDFPEAMLKQFRSYYLEAKENLNTVSFDDIDVVTPAGKRAYQSGILVPMVKDNQFDGMISAILDHTERKLAEEALRKSEELYKKLVDTIPDIIIRTDLDGKILFINDYALSISGYSRDEIEGQNILTFISPEDWDRVMQNSILMMENRLGPREYQLVMKDGRKIPFEMNGDVLQNEDGTPFGIVTVCRDISDRKEAEKAIQQSEEKFRALFMSMSEAFYLSEVIYDDNGNPCDYRYLEVNPKFEQMIGMSRDQIIGKRYKELVPVDTSQWLHNYCNVALTGEPCTYEFYSHEYRMHFETYAYQPAKGQVSVFVVNSTERKKLEEQLRQAQKMEAVGQLAGGVAHDFNNMLGVIIGRSEMALQSVDPSQPLFANLKEIQKAAERSANLTRQLLAFARKQTIAPRVLDLNETIEGILKILRRLIGEDIDLAWLPESRVWPVNMDPSQIDQILANMCVNSRDAIAGVGKVTIETGNHTFDEAYCLNHLGFVPGEYVLLAVSDDGCGMDKEILNKLFEPFFTTKEMGKGTGLGLATVYGIIKQNNGFINVYSEPGQGTTFKIYLPRYMGKIAQTSAEGPAEKVVGGQETILLIEDELALLNLAKKLLEELGYQVLAASTPSEIIRVAKENAGEIHLLITDVVMPEMNGRDLAKNIISIHPGIKCLFMSGYTGNVIVHRGMLDDNVNFIQKPFSIQALAAKVREVLDSK